MKTAIALVLALAAAAATASPVSQPSNVLNKRRMCESIKCIVCTWIDSQDYCEKRYNLVADSSDIPSLNITMKA